MNQVMPSTYRSSVSLSEADRTRLTDVLAGVLAASLDLRSMTKSAHWNLRGPFFFARHELFDRLAEHLDAQSDAIAERIGTLGSRAYGTSREVAERSGLPAYPSAAVVGEAHLNALVERLAAFATMLRAGIEVAADVPDPATEDLLTETLRVVELDMWFLESHL